MLQLNSRQGQVAFSHHLVSPGLRRLQRLFFFLALLGMVMSRYAQKVASRMITREARIPPREKRTDWAIGLLSGKTFPVFGSYYFYSKAAVN